MPKIDKNGQEYIEQDGKRYYRTLLGGWEAEKDWLGNDKVEMDIFGNPKINTDIFGNQIVETDMFGNPYVEPEKKDDSGCYLTTACMRAMGNGFDDDCEELTILRSFRDNYVKEKHPEAVEEYCQVAPKIVDAIGKQEDSQHIYTQMYRELVQGTIQLIRKGMFAEAFALYSDYAKKLAGEYCII